MRQAGFALGKRVAVTVDLAGLFADRRTKAFLSRFNVLWVHFHDFAER